jgi:hypothetical protein
MILLSNRWQFAVSGSQIIQIMWFTLSISTMNSKKQGATIDNAAFR